MSAATPEALEQALAENMLRHEWPNSPLVPFSEQDERIRNYWLGQAKAQIAGPLAPILAALQRVTAERDEARKDQKAAEDSNDALNEKLHALAPHGSCACSYDKPGDVCMHHSPALATATAEAASLRAENDRLRAACVAAQKSIARFPGSVHDRAMAKIDKALGVVPPDFADPDEAEVARLRAEVEAKDRALKLLLVFVDCAGGEGIVLGGGSYVIPDTDAADLCVDAAKALGIEFAGPEYMALIEQGQRLHTALARAATAGEGRSDG
jgi:hypothetical protein